MGWVGFNPRRFLLFHSREPCVSSFSSSRILRHQGAWETLRCFPLPLELPHNQNRLCYSSACLYVISNGSKVTEYAR